MLVVNFLTTSSEPCFYSCFALPLFQFNQTRWLSTKSNATLLPPLHLILSSAIPTTNNPKTSKPNFIPPSSRYPLPLLVFSLISLLTGFSGIAISDLQSRTCSSFSLWQSEDTFRAFYSGSGRRSIDWQA